MSRWDERFENHQVHSTLEQIESALGAIEVGTDGLTPAAFEALDRLWQVQKRAISALDRVDPAVTSHQTLTNLNNHANKILEQLRQFDNNGNESHLNNANSHAENFLTQISLLPTVRTAEDVEEVRESVTSFRKAAGQYLRYLEKEKDDLESQIEDLRQEATEIRDQVESQKNRVDNTITQFQEQFSEAESKRQERSAQAERDRDKEFSDALQNAKDRSAALLSDQKDSLNEFVDSIREERRKSEENLTDRANSLIEDLQESKKKAGELVQIINNSGMVGGFQKEANSQRNWAIAWSVVTVASLVGLISFAIAAFMATVESGEFDLGLFGARAFVAASFGILGAYSERQAEKHRKAERRNRRLELEIASIGPYLSDLPPEKQHEVRIKIADRVFGQVERENEESSDEEAMTGSAVDLLRMTLNNLTRN